MKWQITDDLFSFSIDNQKTDQDYISILRNLTDNGVGTFNEGVFHIPAYGVYELSEGQRKLLNLPNEYPYFLRVESSELINNENFKYLFTFSQSKEFGRYTVVSADFPVVTLKSKNGVKSTFLLPESHYNILKEIQSFNSRLIIEDNPGYRSLSRIKFLSCNDPSIILNDYLGSYNVVPVENLKITIDYKDEQLEVRPNLPDNIRENMEVAENEFADKFDKRNKVLPVYTLDEEDGREYKILIPNNAEEQLKEIKSNLRQVSDPEVIQQIIDTPEQFLDENIFDLRGFYSDRVIEIGLYKPTFYSFVCPYKSEWIPGFIIEDKYNGNTNVILKTKEDIAALEQAIAEAEKREQKEVSYRGYKIDINQAREFLNFAKEQNKTPNERIDKDGNGKKVLIIEDNAESLGYKEDSIDNETPDEYELQKIEGIRENILLKPHQNAGVAWLQYLSSTQSRGCILADDMGLGKTLQVLCFIEWHNRNINKGRKPYLIVAPVSLLDNWKKEIDKFIKDDIFDPVILHGGVIKKKANHEDVEWLKKQDIILTNYETVRGGQFNICAVDYAVVVLDEAQKIKTPGTYVTCAAKALKAEFKIAMTGTPVENSFVDLWCIMDFAIPGLLGNAKEFAAQYQAPLKHEDTDPELLGRELRDRMGVFFLRRRKCDVLKDLPDKKEIKEEVQMTSYQESSYINAIINSQKTDGYILELLNKLRKISDSPFIDQPNTDIETIPVRDLIESSGKIKETLRILDQIERKKEKVIVFCIYKESQRILQRVIQNRYGITPRIINGDTKVITTSNRSGSYSRQQAIDSFEAVKGFNVIIMSPIAAGMGLNVTAANNVIHFGRHWNPAKEAQATDRAYRIGQEKTVYVYYPITTLSNRYNFASFEQTLDTLLSRKSSLADATLFPTEQTEVRIADFQGLIQDMEQIK